MISLKDLLLKIILSKVKLNKSIADISKRHWLTRYHCGNNKTSLDEPLLPTYEMTKVSIFLIPHISLLSHLPPAPPSSNPSSCPYYQHHSSSRQRHHHHHYHQHLLSSLASTIKESKTKICRLSSTTLPCKAKGQEP